MDRAGADDHQQAWVFTVEDGAHGAAVALDLFAKAGIEGQVLLELQRAGQALGQRLVGRWQDGGRQGAEEKNSCSGFLGWRRVLPARGPTGVFDNQPDWL